MPPFGARQRALVVVMWRAGLRIAEALAVKPNDVDLERGAIAASTANSRAALSQSGDRRYWDMPGHRRSIDVSPEGRALARARVAEPVEPLPREALLARGLAPNVIDECRRRRRYQWIDFGLEPLS
jgi:hypothetical protein